MTEPEPLYHRLIDASNGKLANLAEARRLIAEAIGALSRAQAARSQRQSTEPKRSWPSSV